MILAEFCLAEAKKNIPTILNMVEVRQWKVKRSVKQSKVLLAMFKVSETITALFKIRKIHVCYNYVSLKGLYSLRDSRARKWR